MRKNLLFTLIIIFPISIFSQTNDEYLSTKFVLGYPKDIEPIKEQLGLKNLKYANFETRIDSIKIVFGELMQGNTRGYWISSYFNNNLVSFSTVSLVREDSSDNFSNNIDINLGNSSKKISLHVKYNPAENEILYSWLDGDKKSDKLKIQKVNQVLEENKLLPELNLKTLTGKNISSTDFKGKYLVINWWATTCAPCRQEIPGLNKLADKFSSNSNIVFLAIAFDEKNRVESYLSSNEFKYVQTLGDKNVSRIFGESFPKNLIVDPEGKITYFSEGGHENTYLKIEEEIVKHIN